MWSAQEFSRVRQKSYKYLLKSRFLWKHGKARGEEDLRVTGDEASMKRILEECHDVAATGHKGIQPTYERVIALYWWLVVYKEVCEYVQIYFIYQIYSKLRHRDGLTPTCPKSLHFQWGVDIVYMPRR